MRDCICWCMIQLRFLFFHLCLEIPKMVAGFSICSCSFCHTWDVPVTAQYQKRKHVKTDFQLKYLYFKERGYRGSLMGMHMLRCQAVGSWCAKSHQIKLQPYNMRFEVLVAVKMSVLVFWLVTPCGFVGRYQHFGETYCLHLPTQYYIFFQCFSCCLKLNSNILCCFWIADHRELRIELWTE
jgi:hypothetical protein